MRDEVVRVVGARARVPERPEHLAWKQGACRHAVRAVGIGRRALEHALEIVSRERRPGAGGPLDGGLWVDLDASRIECRDERLDLVVAERPEELRRDLHGAGAASGNSGMSNCTNQVWPFASRAVNPGLVPARFSRSRTHFSGAGRGVRVGAARQAFGRDALRADAVGEPARVRHFIDGVDVAGGDVGRLRVWPSRTGCTSIRRTGRCRAAGVGGAAAFRLARERIVVVETWSRRHRRRRQRRRGRVTRGQRRILRRMADIKTPPRPRRRGRNLRCRASIRCAAEWLPDRAIGTRGRGRSSCRRG